MTAGANSAERILAILDLFSEDQLEWTPEQLMERLGYSRPTLYRYLKTLREAGLLTSMPNAGFTLGPRVTELDFLMRKSDPLILHGTPLLEALAEKYPCSGLLVRWYGQKLLCVASTVSNPEVNSSYPRGRPMPLARGAISRAILAFLPRRKQAALIADNMHHFRDLGLGADVDEVIVSLRQVRREGVVVARGEVTRGVVGVAAPVFDAGRAPIAAICLTSDDKTVNGARITRISQDVRTAADRLSRSLSDHREEQAIV